MAQQRSTTARIRAIRGQVDAWRRRRDRGRGMPEALWASAVDLAAEIGVYAAAQGLGVDYGSLRSRLLAREAKSAEGDEGAVQRGFVDAGSVAELASTTGRQALAPGDPLEPAHQATKHGGPAHSQPYRPHPSGIPASDRSLRGPGGRRALVRPGPRPPGAEPLILTGSPLSSLSNHPTMAPA